MCPGELTKNLTLKANLKFVLGDISSTKDNNAVAISAIVVFSFKNLVQFWSVFCENHNIGFGFVENGAKTTVFSILCKNGAVLLR